MFSFPLVFLSIVCYAIEVSHHTRDFRQGNPLSCPSLVTVHPSQLLPKKSLPLVPFGTFPLLSLWLHFSSVSVLPDPFPLVRSVSLGVTRLQWLLGGRFVVEPLSPGSSPLSLFSCEFRTESGNHRHPVPLSTIGRFENEEIYTLPLWFWSEYPTHFSTSAYVSYQEPYSIE